MPTLTDLLDTAAGDEGTIDPADVHRRVRHRRRRRRMGAGVLAVAVAIGGVGTVGLLRDDASNVAVTSGQPREAQVFSFATETQLVFDDGTGYVLVDLDSGRALRRSQPVLAPGDWLDRIELVGDQLVVTKVPPGEGVLVIDPATGDADELDGGPTAVPAGDRARLWLVPGQRTTSEAADATLVELDGEVVAGPARLPDDRVIGVEGAFDDALVLVGDDGDANAWTPDTGIDTDAAFPGLTPEIFDVSVDLIAYATDPGSIEIRERTGALRTEIAKLGGSVSQLAWSPDGEHMAVSIQQFTDQLPNGLLFLFDADGNGGRLGASFDIDHSNVAWSHDGRFLFLAAAVDDAVELTAFDTALATSETVRLAPLGMFPWFDAFDRGIGPDLGAGDVQECPRGGGALPPEACDLTVTGVRG